MKLSKRLLSAFASAVCTLTVCAGSLTFSASAEKFNELEYSIDNATGTIHITGCDSTATSVTIPESIQSMPVTMIALNAFKNCSSLTQVQIPDTVSYIASQAFYGCSSLKSVNIPETVTTIGVDAFYGTDVFGSQTGPVYYVGTGTGKWAVACEKATAVSIDSDIVGIADNTFENCGLETVTIPSKVKTIGHAAFSLNKDLRTVTIPSSVKTINSSAFKNCTSLRTAEIGTSVESIGASAFENCESLRDIKIPDSVKQIGELAFNNTYDYQDQAGPELYISTWLVGCQDSDKNLSVNIKKGTKGIADCAFQNKTFVISANIPEGVTTIGAYAFSGCTKLSQLTLPNTVATINKYAFNNTAIPSITLSKSVKKIGERAFAACNNLDSITILNPTCDIFDSANTIYSAARMYVTEGSTAYDYALKYGRKYDWASDAEYYTGDVNNSGDIDFLDLVMISKHLAGISMLTAEQVKLGDVTQSGDIDFLDLVAVSKKLAGVD